MNIEEIGKIETQVKEVIAYSQNTKVEPNTKNLIKTWYKAKEKFINAFGGKPIWESPEEVIFSLDSKEKYRRICEFSVHLSDTYGNDSLCRFIEDNADTFYDNQVSKSYEVDGKTIPHGMKLVKAFKYFENDKKVLDKLQSEASQIIQEDKVTGKLCFSVHPLDFLSSSENTYNWRSCHALDGEYRAGNLSYMLDESTIICYIKGIDNVKLPHFSPTVLWNSKKWRVLMFMSDKWDMVALGRQYPFSLTSGISTITDKLLKVLGKEPWDYTTLTDDRVENYDLICPHINIRGRLIPIEDIVIDTEEEPLYYNDLLRSTCYNMKYTYDRINVNSYQGYFKPVIHIGGRVKCPFCGERYIEGTDIMMCDTCDYKYGTEENELYAICDCCGTRFFREDAEYVALPDGDEDIICPQCADNSCVYCESCGEILYKDDCIYDRDYDDYVCRGCYEARHENEEDREEDY